MTDFLKKWGATMGKSCWDCIHCDVCANIDGFSHHVSDVSKCKHFKGKADIEPVKHGYWKHVAGMNSKCSECDRYFPVSEFDKRPFDVNCCPYCGAKMDGKEVQE